MKTTEQLKSSGFTESAITEYVETIDDYADELFERSIIYSEYDKHRSRADGVTGEHVVGAARKLAKIFAKPRASVLGITAHVSEYVFFFLTGLGVGCISKWWGVPLAGLSISFAFILIEVRQLRNAK